MSECKTCVIPRDPSLWLLPARYHRLFPWPGYRRIVVFTALYEAGNGFCRDHYVACRERACSGDGTVCAGYVVVVVGEREGRGKVTSRARCRLVSVRAEAALDGVSMQLGNILLSLPTEEESGSQDRQTHTPKHKVSISRQTHTPTHKDLLGAITCQTWCRGLLSGDQQSYCVICCVRPVNSPSPSPHPSYDQPRSRDWPWTESPLPSSPLPPSFYPVNIVCTCSLVSQTCGLVVLFTFVDTSSSRLVPRNATPFLLLKKLFYTFPPFLVPFPIIIIITPSPPCLPPVVPQPRAAPRVARRGISGGSRSCWQLWSAKTYLMRRLTSFLVSHKSQPAWSHHQGGWWW